MLTYLPSIARIFLATALLLELCAAEALTFRRVDERVGEQVIEATGLIEPGDTQRLAAQIALLPRDPIARSRYEVILSSTGGSLAEGLRMGQFFRQRAVSTFVRRGDSCFSACAIAFLGGTQAAEVDTGVGRYLEVGAKLGFHAFSTDADNVVLANEAFDSARVVYAVLLAYAAEMQDIDLSLFSTLLSVKPSSIHVVTTARELVGLGITVLGSLPPRPSGWARNACIRHVVRVRPINDWPIDERVPPNQVPTVATSSARLRQMLIGEGRIFANPLSTVPIEILAELAFSGPPTYPVHRIDVVRGAGFYYDHCFAYAERDQVYTLLLDTNITWFERIQHHSGLSVYAEDVPLWRP